MRIQSYCDERGVHPKKMWREALMRAVRKIRMAHRLGNKSSGYDLGARKPVHEIFGSAKKSDDPKHPKNRLRQSVAHVDAFLEKHDLHRFSRKVAAKVLLLFRWILFFAKFSSSFSPQGHVLSKWMGWTSRGALAFHIFQI